MDNDTLRVLLVVVISYLLGSLPTAYLVGRLKNVNIFEVGSGNMGATNVIRAIGFGWGVGVWLFDSIKGIIAILIARQIMSDRTASATTIAAIVAIVGHNWSLFATLLTATVRNGRLYLIVRGGKGAATAFGTLLMVAPWHIVLIATMIGAIIIALTRYVSLAVLLIFAISTIWIIVLAVQGGLAHEFTYYSLCVAILIAVRFRENIQRLLEGRERRLGESA